MGKAPGVPEAPRFDTVRDIVPSFAPPDLPAVLEGLKQTPGLEGKVHVTPDTPDAQIYDVRVDVELPSGNQKMAEGGVHVVRIALIEERYAVQNKLDPGLFAYDEGDENAVREAARAVNMKIRSYI